MTRCEARVVRGSLTALALGMLIAGCAQELTKQPPPGARVEVLFDPAARDAEGNPAPVVPIPTDLARDAESGLLAIPDRASDSAAQRAFNRYLGSLSGYPTSSTAEVRFSGPLAAAATTPEQLAQALAVVRLPDGGQGAARRVPAAELSFGYAAEEGGTSRVTIARTPGWERGASYALFVDGSALSGAAGEPVIRSLGFELVAGAHPICADDGAGRCTFNHSSLLRAEIERTVRDDPANADEGAEQLTALVHAAELEAATALEQLRRTIDGLLVRAEEVGLDRQAVAVAWSFSTSGQVEALFDPTTAQLPLPANDLLLAREDDAASGCTTGHVCLPAAPGEGALDRELRLALNTLDGFSTNGPIWASFSGPLDRRSITEEAVRVINTSTLKPHPVSLRFDEERAALVITPTEPYAEQTRYAVVLTSRGEAGSRRATAGLSDREGNRVVPSPIFALARLGEPLVLDGASQISGFDDATATQLEQLRAQWAPLFAAAPAFDIAREDVVLAWTFLTQSLSAPLAALRALPWEVFGDPQSPHADGEQPALGGTLLRDKAQLVAEGGLTAEQAALFGGLVAGCELTSYDARDPASGRLWPAARRATAGRPAPVPCLLLLPEATAAPGGARPAAGWPVVYFHHGLNRAKEDALALAAPFVARGFAVIASDAPFHGARSRCTKDAHCAAPGTCDAPRGACSTALADEDGDGVPDASGGIGPGESYFDTDNPLTLRDNLQQTVIDAAALLRALKLGAAERLAGASAADLPLLDADRVHYVGQSLGGIVGTLLLALDSLPRRGVLAVPGGPWVFGIAAQSAVFSPYLAELSAARGVEPGSLDELQLQTVFQWLLDGVDAVSFAPFVQREQLDDPVTGGKVTQKSVIVLKAALDRTMPPGATQRLADLIGVDTGRTTFAGQDHGFLLRPAPDANATAAAQQQAALFVDTGEICTPQLADGTCTVP